MEKEILRKGLSEKEVKKRLKIFGKNIFWEKRGFDWLRFSKEQIFNSFNLILFFVFLISFFGGGKKIESLLLFFFLLVAIFLSLFSELNFHRLSLKLEENLQKKVWVLRDGKQKFIQSQFLVPGDIIFLVKGEIVPADCKVLKNFDFFVNEQSLTGENLPIEKKKGDLIFAGTEVVEGEGVAEVMKTGRKTRFSKIGGLALETFKKSAYQKELEKFSKALIKVVLIFFLFLFSFHLLVKPYSIKEILAFSLILGISIIPEFFPPITVLTLSIFTKEFAKRGALIKRLTAIEDLGTIDVLCVDKTGTITTNKLELEKIESQNPDEFLIFSLSTISKIPQRHLADFKEGLKELLSSKIEKEIKKTKLIARKLFDPKLRISQAILEREGEKFLIILGAPEYVLSFSESKEKEDWLEKLKKFSEQGFRTYALSLKKIKEIEFIEKAKEKKDLHFLGMAVFRDSLKETAKETMLKARDLGLKAKILTGDRPEVAKKVALEIGLIKEDEKVFTEEELLRLSEEDFDKVVKENDVFARVSPETKYKIVKSLQKEFQVGYLGEGINDLPVIKLADVGLVVESAVDAAKEISDIILLKKDLKLIVDGIHFGRKAFFNILKFLRHTMSGNFGNFFSIGFLSIFLPFLPLTPLQIIATDFLTDLPLFALATDRALEKEIKRQFHYKTKELYLLLIALGLVAGIFNLLAYLFFKNFSPQFLRTILFLQTTLSGIFVFYSIRTNGWFFKSSPSFLMHLTIILSFFLLLLLFLTPLYQFFQFSKIPFSILSFFFFFNVLFLFCNDLVKKLVLKKLGFKD